MEYSSDNPAFCEGVKVWGMEKGEEGQKCSSPGACGWRSSEQAEAVSLCVLRFQPGLVSQARVWWSESFSGCKSYWQFLGRPALGYMKIGAVTKATKGGKSFQKEHLVIFFNPLQLEIGTLLLNSSFYGYRGLYRQPFQRLSLCSHIEPSYLRGFCFIATYNIIYVKSSHRVFLSSVRS